MTVYHLTTWKHFAPLKVTNKISERTNVVSNIITIFIYFEWVFFSITLSNFFSLRSFFWCCCFFLVCLTLLRSTLSSSLQFFVLFSKMTLVFLNMPYTPYFYEMVLQLNFCINQVHKKNYFTALQQNLPQNVLYTYTQARCVSVAVDVVYVCRLLCSVISEFISSVHM